ncbi:MAG TPA: sialidase family protein, partial [bacterium]|nr:sialidase family protein [bacterium]
MPQRAASASAARHPFPTPPPRTTDGPVTLLISTAKGLFCAKSDRARESWRFTGPTMLGAEINHTVADPRGKSGSWLMGASTGHLGPTVFRSTDKGKTWQEAAAPPKFKEGTKRYGKPLSVKRVFWLTPGHASEPGVWYAGSVPFGLFRSEDDGATWAGLDKFNYHKDLPKWGFEGGTPGGPITHSVIVDPRDP